jgi:hypothetical protein
MKDFFFIPTCNNFSIQGFNAAYVAIDKKKTRRESKQQGH